MERGHRAGSRLGRYELAERLGAGGMGEVYRARDDHLSRDVAIKVLPAEWFADEGARRRFRGEAQALARLSHPNIGHVYDFDTDEGVDFLVMELVPGEALSRRVARGALPEADVAALGVQLAAALEEAHSNGIVHRDLKPANLIATPRGELKVLDFGLAKLLGPASGASLTAELTREGSVAGTGPYMAPEQLRAQPVDGRTDIWAAGVVLYELVTGRRPFAYATSASTVDGILNRAPEPPSRISSVSPELERVVMTCLAKDPGERYQSVSELREALEGLVRPADGSEPSRLGSEPRGALRGRRGRLLALGLAGVVIVAAGASMLGLRGRRIAAGPVDSLAVLPLVNLSGDPGQEFYADGMTEALIAELAKLRALKVISRTSVMQYKDAKQPLPEIARALGVRGVIEGSVMRVGGAVRITVQLIDAASDRHLWAESYTREATDVLRLQGEVARAIAREVRVAVSPEEQAALEGAPKVDPEAHDLLLQGFYLQAHADTRRDAGERQLALFRQAVVRAPEFGLAHLALASSLFVAAGNGYEPMDVGCAAARAELRKTIELDPSLPGALTLSGELRMHCDYDWTGAESDLVRALEVMPGSAGAHSAYAWLLSSLGRHDGAIEHVRRARELDPLNEWIAGYVAWTYYRARRFDDATTELQVMFRAWPDSIFGKWILGLVRIAQGRYEDAREVLLSRKVGQPGMNFLVGVADGRGGRLAESREVLDYLFERRRTAFVPPTMIAAVYAAQGEADQAIEWLDKSIEEGSMFLDFLAVDPLWDPLRGDPRFSQLVRRIGLAGTAPTS